MRAMGWLTCRARLSPCGHFLPGAEDRRSRIQANYAHLNSLTSGSSIAFFVVALQGFSEGF